MQTMRSKSLKKQYSILVLRCSSVYPTRHNFDRRYFFHLKLNYKYFRIIYRLSLQNIHFNDFLAINVAIHPLLHFITKQRNMLQT